MFWLKDKYVRVVKFKYCTKHHTVFTPKLGCEWCHRAAWSHLGFGDDSDESQVEGRRKEKELQKNWEAIYIKEKRDAAM